MAPTTLTPKELASPAPELQVAQWLGTPSPLEALRGRVVAMHAFQMLCPGCVLHGIPQASRIHHSFDPAEVAVIGLHSVFEHHDAMGPTSLAAFLHEFRVPFPVAVDDPGVEARIPKTMAAYGLQGTPSLILIDRDGLVRANWFGRPEDLAVGAAIASLVAQQHPRLRSDTASTASSGCSQDGCEAPVP